MNDAYRNHDEMAESSSFPIVTSVAQAPHMNSERMSMMATGTNDLHVAGWEHKTCHVLFYSSAESSGCQKTSILFDCKLEAVELVQSEGNVLLLVVTRDGRLWRCSPKTLGRGTVSFTQVMEECKAPQTLLGIKLLSSCVMSRDATVVLVAAGSTLTPPQVMRLDTNGDVIDSQGVSGLQHVRAAVTSIAILSRTSVSAALWTTLNKGFASDDDETNLESVVVLGFADGAIRMAAITDSNTILPPRILGRLDATITQEALGILVIPPSGTTLGIDMLCFLGQKGSLAVCDSSNAFCHVPSGLCDKGPLTCAAAVSLDTITKATTRQGLVATRNDGTTFLLLLTKDAFGIHSFCKQFPVRGDMSCVASCISSNGPSSWLAFGTLDGFAVLMRMDASFFDKLLMCEDDIASEYPDGLLDATRDRSQEATSSKSRCRTLLRRLQSIERMAQRQTANNKPFQIAAETTNAALGLLCGRRTTVGSAVDNGSIVVSSKPTLALPSSSAGLLWTSSLHACVGPVRDNDHSNQGYVSMRPCHGGNDQVKICYGGVAVTESRRAGMDVNHKIEMERTKPVESFLSLAVDGGKRRKTTASDGSAATRDNSSLVVPL